MNALSSDWVSSETASRAYNTIEEAYELGYFSLIAPILGAAAESHVNNTLIDSEFSLQGPEDYNDIFCSMQPRMTQSRSFRDRLNYAANYVGEVDQDRAHYLEELWDLRNSILYEDGIEPLGTRERNTDIREYIQSFEDLLGLQEESIVSRINPGNIEHNIRAESDNRSEFFELLTTSAHENDSQQLNYPASVLAYERFTEEIPNENRPIENWLEDTEDRNLDQERYEAFENQRNLIAHNIEAFNSLDIPEFNENLEFVLNEIIEAEGLAGQITAPWSNHSETGFIPPMYKTEAIW